MSEEDITKDPEYINGYESARIYIQEVMQSSSTKYSQGYEAAWSEHNKKNNVLTLESLDERLKKLEKYTQS
jgi:hypothetical protein